MSVETAVDPSRSAVVLVVEDHETSAQGYQELLTGSGYKVTRAKDGYAALAEMSREPPAVVLLDLKIPKLDGWELLDRLKADTAMSSVPIIVVTGDALPTHHELARSRGAASVLTKPIQPNELLDAVRDALTLRQSRTTGPRA